MAIIFFFYGLAFFTLGLAVMLEARRASALALGHQLGWLAAFGLTHSAVEWADMFLLLDPGDPAEGTLFAIRTVLLPVSGLLLVRFGIGLVSEAGPLPGWLSFVPLVLFIPVGLLVAFALIISLTAPEIDRPIDIWSRYLLLFPGNVLASVGYVRQWRGLRSAAFPGVRRLLLGAALAFLCYAVVAGLVVPSAPYGLAPWINYDRELALTGVPVQVWRALAAVAMMFFVIRALGVFEAEREQQVARLREERARAQQETLRTQSRARESAEAWTEGLVSIGRRIANLEDVDRVLLRIVELAQRLMHADTAALSLWDGERLELKYYATQAGGRVVEPTQEKHPLILKAVQARRPCCFPVDGLSPGRPWRCPISRREILAAAVVPLQLDGSPVGALWVGRYSRARFAETDFLGLEALADHSVIALQHGLMAARLQSLAVTEERSRIAREMHDSLAQILGYLGLQMQTLEALTRQGKTEAVLAELKQARQHIREAQADVRENILSLRTTMAGDIGLVVALEQYVEEFGVQTGIEAELRTEVHTEPHLSPLAETQLVRIVQEALTNVRKHAQARKVQVHLAACDDWLEVTVSDDGIGMNGGNGRRCFGLQTMRERAESAGGSLTIASSVGAGTQLRIRLPLLQQ